MEIVFLTVGKTTEKYLLQGVEEYEKRLKKYIRFKRVELPEIKRSKGLSEAELKKKEGEDILTHLKGGDYLILLDENGKEFTSEKFAGHIQKKMNSGFKRLIFVVGGPYGFSEEVYGNANEKVALSQMTFTHQMIRLFFTEQIYRAFTILRNDPYHHS